MADESPNQVEPDAKVEARLASMLASLNRQLSEGELELVRTRIGKSIAMSDTVRLVPLTNGDEPEIGFAPYQREDA